MEFLERATQLKELNAGLSEAVRGRGGLVLVSGEAGIGKTTLIEKFARRQDRVARVFWGVCDALFSPRPLGPLQDMAPQIGGEVQDLLGSGSKPGDIFAAVLKALSARPAVVIFEDVHWADEGTLDLLRYLGRRINQTSALVVMTYRDDELSPRHPLNSLLGDLVRSSAVRRIPLSPLSEAAVAKMVGKGGIDTVALHKQTGGNPFYVTEVLANPESGIPPTVRDAVLARVARLSRSGHAVLEAAAVIGMRVAPWLLAEVTGAEIQAVEESIAAGMLLAQDDRLVFRHELARQTILESISLPRRQVLHRLVLDSMETALETRDDLARLAHHAEGAGDRAAILNYAPKAAEQASAAAAYLGAATLYTLALRFVDDLPEVERAEMWEKYSTLCDVLDRREAAIDAKRRAIEIWRKSGDMLRYGDSLGRMALALHLIGELDEAKRVNATAIEVLEALPPNRELEIAYNSQALLHLASMENQAGVTLAEKALVLAEKLDDNWQYPRLFETLGLCWLHLDYVRGIEYLERGLAYGLELDQTMRIANSYANLSSVYVEFHHFERAAAYFETGLRYAADRDLEFAVMYMRAWQAQFHLLQGRWLEAAADAEEVLKRPNTSIGSRGPALMALGRLRARQGDPKAVALLDESLNLLYKLGYRQREGMVRAALAEAAWLTGDPERTLVEAQAVYEEVIQQQHPWMTGELAFWRRLAGDAVKVPDWVARPYALHIAGDWQAAASAWEELGCPYEQARALADGHLDAQRQALQIFERLGARPAAKALRVKLEAEGVTDLPRKPHKTTRANPFGLTRRQGEILTLLTENLTNAEIAARLHISPKTVDHHVSAVLAKLNVRTRREAAELAREQSSGSSSKGNR
jgi:DNA-binding CsgD family transcriptional regulator